MKCQKFSEKHEADDDSSPLSMHPVCPSKKASCLDSKRPHVCRHHNKKEREEKMKERMKDKTRKENRRSRDQEKMKRREMKKKWSMVSAELSS